MFLVDTYQCSTISAIFGVPIILSLHQPDPSAGQEQVRPSSRLSCLLCIGSFDNFGSHLLCGDGPLCISRSACRPVTGLPSEPNGVMRLSGISIANLQTVFRSQRTAFSIRQRRKDHGRSARVPPRLLENIARYTWPSISFTAITAPAGCGCRDALGRTSK